MGERTASNGRKNGIERAKVPVGAKSGEAEYANRCGSELLKRVLIKFKSFTFHPILHPIFHLIYNCILVEYAPM